MVVAAAATAMVVNSKRLVGYFTVTFTGVVDDGYFFFSFLSFYSSICVLRENVIIYPICLGFSARFKCVI